MNVQKWKSLIAHSITGKAFNVLNRWWSLSILFKTGVSTWVFVRNTSLQSNTFQFLKTNRYEMSEAFRKSFFVNGVIRLVFCLFGWINRWMKSIFEDSLAERFVFSVQRDCATNPVKYFCSFFFAGFVIWVMLMLLFGGGFSKTEMSVVLITAFLTWFFSLLDINTVDAFANSQFVKWFRSWYEATDSEQR
jgi:ABC-type multidrug transport system fused ATPase/permease subunit